MFNREFLHFPVLLPWSKDELFSSPQTSRSLLDLRLKLVYVCILPIFNHQSAPGSATAGTCHDQKRGLWRQREGVSEIETVKRLGA